MRARVIQIDEDDSKSYMSQTTNRDCRLRPAKDGDYDKDRDRKLEYT